MTLQTDPIEENLDREQCLDLLAATRVGRLAVSLRAEVPTVRPVNYIFDGRSQSIVFRTGEGAKFRGMLLSSRAAFEIDGFDEARRSGWSVIVVGSAERITDPTEIRRLERAGLETWAPGPKPHWLRIRIGSVSGRRIITPMEPGPELSGD